MPQATNSASLVSVNKAAHGFGLQEQLVHTPICARCGLAVMTALESLLSDQWKSTLAGQDTRLAWWVTGGAELDLDPLNDSRPRPERVARMLGGPARGRRPSPDDGSLPLFCGSHRRKRGQGRDPRVDRDAATAGPGQPLPRGSPTTR